MLGLVASVLEVWGQSGVLGNSPTAAAVVNPLVWDRMQKSVDAQPGDGAVEFEFTVTNAGNEPIEILEIRPSCGCTVAQMPSTPWILGPGAKGSFHATVDIHGKFGRLAKSLVVESTAGLQTLDVIVNIPETSDAVRQRNQQLALADRQAVFRHECASCHAAPTATKSGTELFVVACLICHGAGHRASMVPDLLVAREPRDAAFWRRWIVEGKEKTLMPAFAQRHGGPLTDAQIESLVEFAVTQLPTEPRKE